MEGGYNFLPLVKVSDISKEMERGGGWGEIYSKGQVGKTFLILVLSSSQVENIMLFYESICYNFAFFL